MSQEFTIGPLVHNGDHYDCENTFDIDIPFYRKWAESSGGSVLELCCGTGRITLPLYKGGIDITGYDISDSMLSKAREKARALGNEKPAFIKGDIRKINLKKKYSLIFIPFNSLQCIYTIEDVEKVFMGVKKHLGDSGLFIFDIFNPSIHLMVEREDKFTKMSEYITKAGEKVTVKEKCFYDSANQVNRVKWLYNINGKEEINKLDMRCFYPLEMDALLKYNGFSVLHKFGSFTEDGFTSESAKQIYICKIS